MSTADPVWTPADVFYVVQSVDVSGEHEHHVRSPLYETRPQAEAELMRLQAAEPDAVHDVWRSTTYVEPHRWLRPVVLADGTVVPIRGGAQTRKMDQ